jgi:dihydrolipoamide dehydrogenase
MPETSFDVAILGGGPGGYVAAIRAAQLGMSTLLVEKDPQLGGTCLHRGCIPTKALLETASRLDQARQAEEFGVMLSGPPALDMGRAHQRKKTLVRRLAMGIEGLLKKNRVTVLTGQASLDGPGRVRVEGQVHQARHVILATGSTVAVPPVFPVDGVRVLTSDHMLEYPEIPPRLVVVGAGAVGMEFASIYSLFGSQVTVVEMLPRVLPLEDEDISAEVERIFRKRGVTFHTGCAIEQVEVGADSVRLRGRGLPEGLQAEILLVAVGRRANTEGLGLDSVGLEEERGRIPVDHFMRTRVPGIYAIGDLVPSPQLAHVASAEGILAVEHLAGLEPHPVDYRFIPSATYCHPEVASVGLSEAAAVAAGHEVKVGRFPFAALGKAAIMGQTEGFVKVVAEARFGEVLGVHLVGPHATDLVSEAVLALTCEATLGELLHSVHPHPTLSEALMEAAHQAAGAPIHFIPPPTRKKRD